ncbi:MAG TPA: DNA-directed RNA polymerase subunit omega [Blastocatellia bacterium]|nr:DNA-directed RNA polymerase subunit omega [Blastocatellia bacterium]
MPEDQDKTTQIDSKYRLVVLAALRSKQLQKGALPRVQTRHHKSTRVALEEVQNGLVEYTKLPLKKVEVDGNE